MYVCVCHAVTEDDVRDHMAAGACSAKAVRAACGMRPGCGACVRRICDLLAENGAASPATAAAPAPEMATAITAPTWVLEVAELAASGQAAGQTAGQAAGQAAAELAA